MSEQKAKTKKGTDRLYTLIEPQAFANIKWDEDEGRLKYLVKEPEMSEEEIREMDDIKENVIEKLEIDLTELEEDTNPRDYIGQKVEEAIKELSLGLTEETRDKIFYYLKRDLAGLGKLEPLMNDPNLEEVSCDGIEAPIFVVHREYGSIKTDVWFKGEDELNRFVSKLAQRTGRHISAAEPMLEGSLHDGSRLQATYKSEVTRKGPTFTIRKFREDPLTPIDLIENETLDPEMLAYIWHIVERGYSILISGGTATGKTTMLNVASLFIKQDDKIVSIEDTPELRLPHDNWLPAVSRPGYGPQDYGEVNLFDLVKASLRQRPDFVVPGEVRGEEAYVLFQAMATGHAGLATIHAETVEALLNRLLTSPINLSASLLTSLDAVIFLGFANIGDRKVRKVQNMVEVTGMSSEGDVETENTFEYERSSNSFKFNGKSEIIKELIRNKGEDVDKIEESSVWKEIQSKTRFLEETRERGVKDIDEFSERLEVYRRNK
mgnify:CR=1 FL=1